MLAGRAAEHCCAALPPLHPSLSAHPRPPPLHTDTHMHTHTHIHIHTHTELLALATSAVPRVMCGMRCLWPSLPIMPTLTLFYHSPPPSLVPQPLGLSAHGAVARGPGLTGGQHRLPTLVCYFTVLLVCACICCTQPRLDILLWVDFPCHPLTSPLLTQ